MSPDTLAPEGPTICRPRPGAALESLVGNTPLVRLPRLGAVRPGVEILAKLEGRNPGGSVKDRAALAILIDAERRGLLVPGKSVLDASSGNTGIALALLGSARGLPVTVCIPANANEERRRTLLALGATVVLTDAQEGSDGAIREARRLVAESPGKYYYADQYSNVATWRAHYESTGPEILRQTDGAITHFVAGLGTTGTMMGTGRYLKEWLPGIVRVGVQPDSPLHGLEGLKHLGTAMIPSIYDPSVVDVQATASTDEAHEWTRRLAREEGLFVGVSSGANFAAARRVAESLREGLVVTIFCDNGDRYLSERFWDADLC